MNENILNFVLTELAYNQSSSSSSSSTSSTSSSDSEEGKHRRKKRKAENFVEKIVLQYSNEEFKLKFQMSRQTAKHLIDMLAPNIVSGHRGGWPRITPKKALLLTLWYLVNRETFREISHRFNVSMSAAHCVVKKVVKHLLNNRSKFIKWPARCRYAAISRGFEQHGFKNVLGAIDFCHIVIKKPKSGWLIYKIPKSGETYSIILQAVVDSNKKFLNVYVGEPGATTSQRLLRQSSLYSEVNENPHLFSNYYLIGDNIYPSLSWLVTPYKDNVQLTPNQGKFNLLHLSTKIVVDNAFSVLKSRFQRLVEFKNNNLQYINRCVIAACILHNIIVQCDELEEDFGEIDQHVHWVDEGHSYSAQKDNIDRREEVFHSLYGS